MIQRFQKMREQREDGFTLIELLVVILIIAILAAIAIPVFLRQRERGYVAQSESALKNAATAAESWATQRTDAPGSYATLAKANLVAEGFREVNGVTLTVDAPTDANEFCLKAVHTSGVGPYYWDSDVGKPTTAACT
jgi:type IV pilus assembly protein PilA